MTKNQVDEILNTIGFYESFNLLLNTKFPNINYGTRLGVISFESLLEADKKYTYSGEVELEEFQMWTETLNSLESNEEELLIVCLKIFDWGNVLTGNVKSVVKLYEEKKLKDYLKEVSELLKSNEVIHKSDVKDTEIVWSSGWTKVYSFLNPNILIYDSRVSAFLNYSLIQNYNEFNEKQKFVFHQLSNVLFNFSGALGRERKVSSQYGFKNQHPKGVRGFNANLVASWVLQLTKDKLKINSSMRSFERAFFMLGFDLKQIGSTQLV